MADHATSDSGAMSLIAPHFIRQAYVPQGTLKGVALLFSLTLQVNAWPCQD